MTLVKEVVLNNKPYPLFQTKLLNNVTRVGTVLFIRIMKITVLL